MGNAETKQYCATIKVWMWAFNENHANRMAEDLAKNQLDVAGYEIVELKEDKEV